MRAGRITSVRAGGELPGADSGDGASGGGVDFLDPEYALAQAKAADEWRLSGRPIGGAARGAGGAEGHHRHGGHADRERVGAARGADAVAGCGGGGAAAGGGRGDHGQDGHHGVRHADRGQDAEPAQPGAHAGGIVERVGGGGGRGDGAARAREPDGRLDDPARRPTAASTRLKPTHGLVSRHGMFQLSRSLDHVGLFARDDRGSRAAAGGARGLRRARSRHASARAGALPRAWPPEEPPIAADASGSSGPARWDRVAEDAQAALRARWSSTWAAAWRSSS